MKNDYKLLRANVNELKENQEKKNPSEVFFFFFFEGSRQAALPGIRSTAASPTRPLLCVRACERETVDQRAVKHPELLV